MSGGSGDFVALSARREKPGHAALARRDPIARPKLAELVQNRLLAVIQADNLRPGDPLPSERELMQSYAVGRPSIREAMQNLKRLGLIEINHGERPRIAAPSFERMVAGMSETMRHVLVNSPATLDHLKEARATFEMTMAQIAARKRNPADVRDLYTILAEQESARFEFELLSAGRRAFSSSDRGHHGQSDIRQPEPGAIRMAFPVPLRPCSQARSRAVDPDGAPTDSRGDRARRTGRGRPPDGGSFEPRQRALQPGEFSSLNIRRTATGLFVWFNWYAKYTRKAKVRAARM